MEQDKIKINPEIKASEFVAQLEKLREQLKAGLEPDNVLSTIRASLGEAYITDPYMAKIMKDIGRAVKQGMLQFMGHRFLLDEYGINLEEKKFGIFDPNDAQVAERDAIYMNLRNRPLIPRLQREHDGMMQNWIRIYESRYNETINR